MNHVARRVNLGIVLSVVAVLAMTGNAAAAPSLSVTPSEGPVKTPYVLSGTGFTPGQSIDLKWQTVEGNRVSGSGFGEVLWPLPSAKADANGAFTFNGKAPEDLGGPAHRIQAMVGNNVSAQTTFTITRTADITPKSGPAGTAITLHMTGGGWTQYDNIVAVSYDNAFMGFMCSFNSQGNMTLWLPAAGAVGLHTIDVWPALYWGPSDGPTPWKIAHLSSGDQPSAVPHFHFEFQVTPGVAAAKDMLPAEGAITNFQAPLAANDLLQRVRASTSPALALNAPLLPPGSPLLVAGGGLHANDAVKLVWSTVNARVDFVKDQNKGWNVTPTKQDLATATVGADGTFLSTLKVPYDFGGDHDVLAVVNGKTVAQTTLRIQPHFDFQGPMTVRPGETVTVRGVGLGYEKYTAVWSALYDNRLMGWISAFETRGNATLKVVAVGAPGEHFLDIHEGSNGWPYLNLWESPWPWEPAQHFHFTVAGQPVASSASAPAVPPFAPRASGSGGASITTSPTTGPVNTPVVMTGTGFAPGASVDLVWHTMVGNDVVSVPTPTAWPLGTAKADAKGAFTYSFAAPDDLGGPAHDVEASVGGATAATTQFLLTRSAVMAPASGPAGTQIAVDIKGGGWTQYDNIVAVTYDNAFIGFMCSANSQGSMTLWLPATGDPGDHTIDVYPALWWGSADGPTPWKIPHLIRGDQPSDLPSFHFTYKLTAGAVAAKDMLPREGGIKGAQGALSQDALLGNVKLSKGPTLALNSVLLPPGSDLLVAGGGFTVGDTVKLTWSTVTAKTAIGADKNKGWVTMPLTKDLATATVGATGQFVVPLKVPYDFGGDHDVQALVNGKKVAQTSLRIQPHFDFLGPATVKAGEKVTVRGVGLGYEKYTSIWTLLYDNQLAGWVSAYGTQGNVTFETTAVGAPGEHYLDIHEGSNGWPYLNLFESPWPWEPAQHFHFTVASSAVDGAKAQGAAPGAGAPALLLLAAVGIAALRRARNGDR